MFFFNKLSFTFNFCLNISWTICPSILFDLFRLCLMMPWLTFKLLSQLCVSKYYGVLVYCPRTASLRLCVSLNLLIQIERFFIEKVWIEGHSRLNFCFSKATRLIFYCFSSDYLTISYPLTFLKSGYIHVILRLFLLTLFLLTQLKDA